jgi:hypothetical protein
MPASNPLIDPTGAAFSKIEGDARLLFCAPSWKMTCTLTRVPCSHIPAAHCIKGAMLTHCIKGAMLTRSASGG